MIVNRFNIGLLGLSVVLMQACSAKSDKPAVQPKEETVRFANTEQNHRPSFSTILTIFKRSLFEKRDNIKPEIALVQALDKEALTALDDGGLYLIKLGHSSLLLKVYGEYWLIDPVFGERASPLSFAGPKRFEPPAISLEDLPPIDKVLLSHNHYDHLDKGSIEFLATRAAMFLVPLGVDQQIMEMGVPAQRIQTFNWWDEQQFAKAKVVFTPTQHFSGRTPWDSNETLWGSWTLLFADLKVFFSGDSGYFGGFKEIGERYGPFDITLMENGAYDENWPAVHMFPEQTVQAHLDLQGRIMIPIHNSTFDLAFHPWDEPLNEVRRISQEKGVSLSLPAFGEIVDLHQSTSTDKK
jgi:L-ascorbate metabolism protein UlaG (beta-lactamase superfamily)